LGVGPFVLSLTIFITKTVRATSNMIENHRQAIS